MPRGVLVLTAPPAACLGLRAALLAVTCNYEVFVQSGPNVDPVCTSLIGPSLALCPKPLPPPGFPQWPPSVLVPTQKPDGSLENLNPMLRTGPGPHPPRPHRRFLSAPQSHPALLAPAVHVCALAGPGTWPALCPDSPVAGSSSDWAHLLAVLPRPPDLNQPACHSRSLTLCAPWHLSPPSSPPSAWRTRLVLLLRDSPHLERCWFRLCVNGRTRCGVNGVSLENAAHCLCPSGMSPALASSCFRDFWR